MSLYENRIVIKVGTSTLINAAGKNDLDNTEKITRVLSDISNIGYQIILVSSGAIAIGANKMNLAYRSRTLLPLRQKQAAAAVGQCRLLFLYDRFFGFYDKTIAQILLTAEDIEQEQKKDNLIKTFDTLLEDDIIPIVNANDSVNIDEILTSELQFGDNDMLSAVVAVLCRASKLIILSDIEAVYENTIPVARIENIGDISSYTASRVSGRGIHSIENKIKAARYSTSNGIDTYIMNGRNPEMMYDIIKSKSAGVLFAGRK